MLAAQPQQARCLPGARGPATVGLTAAVLSYKHQFEPAAGHGESAVTAKPLPISIDGLLLAGTLAVLDASRRQTGHASAARITVGLGVAMTMWANIVHGLGFGWSGIRRGIVYLVSRESFACYQHLTSGLGAWSPSQKLSIPVPKNRLDRKSVV